MSNFFPSNCFHRWFNFKLTILAIEVKAHDIFTNSASSSPLVMVKNPAPRSPPSTRDVARIRVCPAHVYVSKPSTESTSRFSVCSISGSISDSNSSGSSVQLSYFKIILKRIVTYLDSAADLRLQGTMCSLTINNIFSFAFYDKKKIKRGRKAVLKHFSVSKREKVNLIE